MANVRDADLARSISQLAEALRELRFSAHNPSYADMANGTGMSRSTVHEIFSGRSIPRRDSLRRLVEYLGGDVDSFYEIWSNIDRQRVTSISGKEWIDRPANIPAVNFPITVQTKSFRASNLYIYFSYANEDDEAVSGKILQLVADTAQLHRSGTGLDVKVLNDFKSIEPQGNWKDRIRLGLSSSTIFLVFISPTYLRSVARRRDLNELLSFLEIQAKGDLAIPLLCASPGRITQGFPNDDLWKSVSEHQWIDISRPLRIFETEAVSWIDLTEHLEGRIDDVLGGVKELELSLEGASVNAAHLVDDFFNSLDTSAFSAIIDRISTDSPVVKVLFGQAISRLQGDVQDLQASPSVARKLLVSRKVEGYLAPTTSRLSSALDKLIELFNPVDHVMRRLFGPAFNQVVFRLNDEDNRPRIVDMDKRFASIYDTLDRCLSKLDDDLEYIVSHYNDVSGGLGYSGNLDQSLANLQDVCLRLAGYSGRVKMWLEEVRAAKIFAAEVRRF